jgi:penicillin V acylase-like amidase (Ntn superfamily)
MWTRPGRIPSSCFIRKGRESSTHPPDQLRTAGQHRLIRQLKLSAPDSGDALANLPSSQIAAGRFVRAVFYTQFVRKADSPDEAVITLRHIMNNFNRPYDLSIDEGY